MLKRRLKEPFGKAGLIVACLALVAALGGTAFAAAKLNSTQKKEVEKISKKFAGAPGKAGAPGATGPAGPAGAGGAKGAAGEAGAAGAAGAQGVQGIQGPPGTTGFTKVLPKGATETGTFAGLFELTEEARSLVSISFSIPLASALDETHVHFINTLGEEVLPLQVEETAPQTACEGSAEEPLAKEGNLCIYEGGNEGPAIYFKVMPPQSTVHATSIGVGTAGGILVLRYQGASGLKALNGSWAVTGS